MSDTSIVTNLLGWKDAPRKNGKVTNKLGWEWTPNGVDVQNNESIWMATRILESLGKPNPNLMHDPDFNVPEAKASGKPLEDAVRDYLANELQRLDPSREWEVRRDRNVWDFSQFEHLKALNDLIKEDENLRVTVGRSYTIKPDVTVGIKGTPTFGTNPWLHAAASCKWSIRSDRVQNIRHENNQLIRLRRGRLPHLVSVTAEPLPSRLISIARGTGEVDITYHIAFDQLTAAVAESDNKKERDEFDEIVGQNRLRDFKYIAEDFVTW